MKEVKGKSFYEDCITRIERNIANQLVQISEFPTAEEWKHGLGRPDRENSLRGLKYSIFGMRLSLLQAMYSKGATGLELKESYPRVAKLMNKFFYKKITKVFHGRQQEEFNQYRLEPHVSMLQMLSLAVLLEIPDEEFIILVDLIDRDKVKDRLFEFFIRSRIPERPTIAEESYKRYLLIPQMYAELNDIARKTDNIESEKQIKEYLEKRWFKNYKHLGGRESLDVKNFDVNSGFVGFWAFEVAAVVKIRGLDDSSFKDNRFYPDRLV